MKHLLGFVLAAGLTLGACSGPGLSPNAPGNAVPNAANSNAANSNAANSNAAPSTASVGIAPKPVSVRGKHGRLVRLVIHIKVPKHGKHRLRRKAMRPNYISAGSRSVTITLNTVNGGPPPAGLLTSATTNISDCTSGCTVFGPYVPPGTDNLSFAVYDQQHGAGDVLSALTQNFTVAVGQNNTLTATLDGVPASFAFATFPSGTGGTPLASTPLALAVYDASGYQITGTYANPVNVADSDNSGATTLSVNAGTPSAQVQVRSDTDTLALAYSGLAIASPNISVAATGATTLQQKFVVHNVDPSSVCDAGAAANVCSSGPQINLYTMSGDGSTATLTATQTGWTDSGYLQDISESDTCGSYATVTQTGSTNPGGGGTVFTVTAGATPAAGTCTITLTGGDPTHKSEQVTLTYTTSGIGVNSRHRANRTAPNGETHAH